MPLESIDVPPASPAKRKRAPVPACECLLVLTEASIVATNHVAICRSQIHEDFECAGSGHFSGLEKFMSKKTPPPTKIKIGRDASSGEFVTVKYAETHPKTTVVETIKVPKK